VAGEGATTRAREDHTALISMEHLKGTIFCHSMSPQRETEEQVEVQVKGDAQQQVDVKPDKLDDCPSSPHDLSVLTMHHVHVAKMAVDGVVRRYTFYLMKIELLCCFNYCTLLFLYKYLFYTIKNACLYQFFYHMYVSTKKQRFYLCDETVRIM